MTFTRCLKPKNLQPYINENLLGALQNLIEFKPLHGGNVHYGYPAAILPEICNVFLSARNDKKLLEKQQHIAQRCEILIRALASVGIIALVDEVTGFQKSRKADALRYLIEKYIEEFARPWMKEFPDSFFIGLDKIYENKKTTSRNRPLYYGKFILT